MLPNTALQLPSHSDLRLFGGRVWRRTQALRASNGGVARS
jgi:hypothetical protein